MNLAIIQRYAPLLSYADKPAGSLTDGDIDVIAKTLGGEKGHGPLGDVLKKFRAGSPGSAALELLGSPAAQDFFKGIKADNERAENTAFIKCPCCERLFETELTSSRAA